MQFGQFETTCEIGHLGKAVLSIIGRVDVTVVDVGDEHVDVRDDAGQLLLPVIVIDDRLIVIDKQIMSAPDECDKLAPYHALQILGFPAIPAVERERLVSQVAFLREQVEPGQQVPLLFDAELAVFFFPPPSCRSNGLVWMEDVRMLLFTRSAFRSVI